jgi:hypothetical protein
MVYNRSNHNVKLLLCQICGYWWRFLGIKPHRAAQCVPGRWIGEPSWWREGCQVIRQKAWPWIIVGNVFWRVPHSLHVNCDKEQVHCSLYNRLNFSSLPNSPYLCSGSQKSLTHPNPHFYKVFIYYWTCYRPDYSWNTDRLTLCNNQSINLCQISTVVVDNITIHNNIKPLLSQTSKSHGWQKSLQIMIL